MNISWNISDKDIQSIKKVLNDNEYQNKLSTNAKTTIQKWTYNKMAKGFIDAVESVKSPLERGAR